MGVRGYRGYRDYRSYRSYRNYRNYRGYRKPMVVRAPHEAFAIPLFYTLPPIEGRAGEGSFYFILVIARAARAYRPSTTVSIVCRVCTMRANTAASLSCTP